MKLILDNYKVYLNEKHLVIEKDGRKIASYLHLKRSVSKELLTSTLTHYFICARIETTNFGKCKFEK